jgi:hypothetical protein
MPTFGRLYKPDARDQGFQIGRVLAPSARRARYWVDDAWTGDQGDKPHCVGFAWTGWLEAGPVFQGPPHPIVVPADIYKAAQLVDEWPDDEPYDGTSVRAGAKVLKRLGFISRYLWAKKLEDVVNALLEVGPVTVGTSWYAGMSNVGGTGRMRARGQLEGGHAYLLTGCNRDTQLIRVRNSWGLDWGVKGRGYISFADFAKLLAMEGEACLAVEIHKDI